MITLSLVNSEHVHPESDMYVSGGEKKAVLDQANDTMIYPGNRDINSRALVLIQCTLNYEYVSRVILFTSALN